MITETIIKNNIKSVQYYHFPETTTTVACIVLLNGFASIGESSCVDTRRFDPTIGKEIAYQNAFEKLWVVFGAIQKDRSSSHQLDFED